jgi:gamma-glutamyltranspeptidase/glutathione hydrolase
MAQPIEQWQVKKAPVRSQRGVVAAQNARAAEVGVEVLREGGNAVDAALATAFALAAVEPWMSGLGGCGYMMVYEAAERRVSLIDFGTRAPQALDPKAFPLQEGAEADSDLFGWPAVVGDRNVFGPLSIGLPSSVAGFGLASERFGSLPWQRLIAPAISLAKAGHPVDWWTTLKVAGEAAALRQNPAAAAVYLPGGLPPVAPDSGQSHLDLGRLADTLAQLAKAGPEDFYKGEIAQALLADLTEAGSWLSAADLAGCRAIEGPPLTIARAGAEIHLPPGLTAGPTFADALARLRPIPAGPPGPEAFAAYAAALVPAISQRMESLGHDGDQAGQGCTTHLSVVDEAGNMVALTSTLLSLFGSKVLSPSTGVMLNNGTMWFDPRPGRPNSIAPGARPLCNMCPALVTRDGAPWFALGASGGRRIMPAVFQMVSFLVDCGMTLEQAVHQPRINTDGGPQVEADPLLGENVLAAIAAEHAVVPVEAMITPNHYANPQVALFDAEGLAAAAQVHHPTAAAAGV